MQQALACATGISDDYLKSSALKDISAELAKQGKLEEAASAMQQALACATGISDDYLKSSALKDISAELAKQGAWQLAESTGLEISRMADRQNCWKTIAENTYKEIGWQKALQQESQFQNDEARLFFLKGWAKAIELNDEVLECLVEAFPLITKDTESIENLLQKFALRELFIGAGKEELIKRLNRTLNIQWAVDIKTQFPQTEEQQRHSTNIDAWLHEIADEDDRERAELWAMKVAKGTMTEQEFSEKLKKLS